jgi:TolA-binding protein
MAIIANGVQLLPNVPVVNQGAQLAQILAILQQMQGDIQQMQGVIQQMKQNQQDMERNISARLMNAQGAMDALLEWPDLPGGGQPANAPATGSAVLALTGAAATALLQQYGLAHQGSAQQRRTRLLRHLGLRG